ncbi:zinc finger DHHC-type palmitoyltransferase GABPI isoform X2 [Arctopsyche grandis]|uniref:zinc finger DHHC-type palmitoyltransferase GABPI isoform X2 n=1 Tax=Arctopsyche grandis TaxID=121162 RepID=UPI00406D69A1
MMLAFINKPLMLCHLRPSQRWSILLSVIAAPLTLLVSALSLYGTVIIFIATAIALLYIRHCLLQTQSRERDRSKSYFFIIWLSSSILFLMCVFHIWVISLLEILPEENVILVVLTTGSIACLYSAKQKAHQLVKSSLLEDAEDSSEVYSNSSDSCILCQGILPSGYEHCIWLDCCIGSDNNKLFSCGVFLGMAALFYGSNLTLTTVCHPFIFYKTILLPDDCSDVYYEYTMAICFVCGLYSLIIALLILWFFIKKTLLWLRDFSGLI